MSVGVPSFLLYTPSNRELYVGGSEVFAIDTNTNSLVSGQPVGGTGTTLTQMVYDPLNGMIFGVKSGSSLLVVIDSRTDKVVSVVTGFVDSVDETFSPGNNELFLRTFDNFVYAVNASDYHLVAKIPVPLYYSSLTYDQDNGLLYTVVNHTVFEIDPTSNSLLAQTIGLPAAPAGVDNYEYKPVFYNPSNHDLYFYGLSIFQNSINGSDPDKLVAVDPVKGSVVASIPIQGLGGGIFWVSPTFAYDPSTGNVLATTDLNFSSGATGLVMVGGSSNTVISSVPLQGVEFGEAIAIHPIGGMVYGSKYPGSLVTLNSSSGAVVSSAVLGTCYYWVLPF
jgi:hypothetical protein